METRAGFNAGAGRVKPATCDSDYGRSEPIPDLILAQRTMTGKTGWHAGWCQHPQEFCSSTHDERAACFRQPASQIPVRASDSGFTHEQIRSQVYNVVRIRFRNVSFTHSKPMSYDAILVLSFGGPEKREDVIPFLENVLRGKPVPRERLLEVAEHYYHFNGRSPINDQCRELIAALRVELDNHGIQLPIYWGNRNWEPYLTDTVRQMFNDGVCRALTYVTSGFSCYSGCRQYRENIQAALRQPGVEGLQIDKLRVFYNHPDFIEVLAEKVDAALQRFPENERSTARVAFTAHSIPLTMSSTSDYVRQLQESCRLVADKLNLPEECWSLVYQSRSGRPEDPWLEPDIVDHLRAFSQRGGRNVVISPIGFLSDHMEVLYDLDDAAAHFCTEHGIRMFRAETPGNHPKFIGMLRKLFQERLSGASRECIGQYSPNHDVCPENCCPAPARPSIRPSGETR